MKDKTTIPALLPCPFCGAEADWGYNEYHGHFAVACKKCDAEIRTNSRDLPSGITAWNRRAAPPPAPAAPSAAQGWLDFCPNIGAVDAEPSLRRMVAMYYAARIDDDDLAAKYVADYLSALPAAPGAQPAQPDALADEREFNGQLVAMLKKMFDAPTMGAGYAILADFAAQFYPGTPVALQPAQDSLTEIESLILAEKERVLSEGMASNNGEIWTVNGGKAAGLQSAVDIIRSLSAARAAQPAGEVVEELSRLGLCWDAEYFPALDPDEEFGIAPENHYRVTITTSLEDTATGWGATFEEAARAALRSGEVR